MALTHSLLAPGELAQKIGANAREARLAQNLSRKSLAKMAGVSESTIKRFETSYFLVENQEGLGLFKTDGTQLIPCAYQRIVRLDDGAFQLTSASGISYFLPIENRIVQYQP